MQKPVLAAAAQKKGGVGKLRKMKTHRTIRLPRYIEQPNGSFVPNPLIGMANDPLITPAIFMDAVRQQRREQARIRLKIDDAALKVAK
jgi:hypothetical protein